MFVAFCGEFEHVGGSPSFVDVEVVLFVSEFEMEDSFFFCFFGGLEEGACAEEEADGV